MNKFIKKELQKINPTMSEWDDNTTKIHIDKIGTPTPRADSGFVVGSNYELRVEEYIINPPPSFTLASNWNFNTVPPERELYAMCIQVMGKMIKFKCRGKTTNIEWEGWLPQKSITVL